MVKYKDIIYSIGKFATSSAVASVVDLVLFTFVLTKIFNLEIFTAEIIAGFVGMVINFILQKRFVFYLQRNLYVAFSLSIGFSLIALFLGGFAIKYLVTIPIFSSYLIIPKVMVMGSKFFFNYLTKRWVFEKKSLFDFKSD